MNETEQDEFLMLYAKKGGTFLKYYSFIFFSFSFWHYSFGTSFCFYIIITTNSTRTNHQQFSELVFTCTVVRDNKKKSCSCLPIIFKSISHKIPIFISMEKRIKTAAAEKEKENKKIVVWQVFHSHNSGDKMLKKKSCTKK